MAGKAGFNPFDMARSQFDRIADMLDLGYLMRGEIIWDKGGSAGRSTACRRFPR